MSNHFDILLLKWNLNPIGIISTSADKAVVFIEKQWNFRKTANFDFCFIKDFQAVCYRLHLILSVRNLTVHGVYTEN